MFPRRSILLVALISLPGFAADESEKPLEPATASADIDGLIEQLDDKEFQSRQDAAKKLVAKGKAAVEPVTKAAQTDSPEVAARCVEILVQLHGSSDADTKQAAEAALKTLTKSPHKSVSQRAELALQSPDRSRFGGRIPRIGGGGLAGRPQIVRENTVEEHGRKIHIREQLGRDGGIVVKITEKVNGREQTKEIKARNRVELRRNNPEAYELYVKHIIRARVRPQMLIGGKPFGGGAPRIQFGGGRNFQMNTRIVNGLREVDVTDDGKKVHITDESGKNIRMRIEETVNGKRETKEYKAGDLDELKKKHPEPAKLYEKYTSGAGAPFRIQINGLGVGGLQPFGGGAGGGALPFGPGAFPGGAPNIQREFDRARKQLEESMERLRRLQNLNGVRADQFRQELERIQQQFGKAEKKLPKL